MNKAGKCVATFSEQLGAYGAQAGKIAKTVGCDLQTGEVVFNAYWDAAKPLANLKEALTKYWETTGQKKFILGLDGRKIMTRSKHSLVNALFQSAGVICAKRSMVYQDIEYRARGWSVDFWSEDWKNKPYVQQLIAYHDELQHELKHSLVQYRKFPSEEACKEWITEQEDRWCFLKSEKGFFAIWSEVVRICQESVQKTSKHYKLNVTLAIDPQFGLNWAECH